jgi:uncharacterized protein (TIGR02145 family)
MAAEKTPAIQIVVKKSGLMLIALDRTPQKGATIMRKLILTTAAVAAAIGLTGCSKTPTPKPVSTTLDTLAVAIDTQAVTHDTLPIMYDTLTDTRDGQTYLTVVIGGKKWMAQNLNYKTPKGSSCYENSDDSCKKFGRLYNWYAAKTACPMGYHLPSHEEWDSLITAAGGENAAGKKLKAKNGWGYWVKKEYGYQNGNGTDDYGFSALPGGRYSDNGYFYDAGHDGDWWTSTERYKTTLDPALAYYIRMRNYENYARCCPQPYIDKCTAISVRCVMDAESEPRDTLSVTSDTRDALCVYTDEAVPEITPDSVSAILIERIPAGYRLINEVRGDLNGDSAEDRVFIIKANDKEMFERIYEDDPDSPLLDNNRGGIMIFFKKGDNYRLALENRQCFEPEHEEEYYLTPLLSVTIKNGNLLFFFETGRARHGWEEYTFRYRNSEFELIGYDEGAPYDCEIISINFLIKKQWTRTCMSDEDDRCFSPCLDDNAKVTWNNITIKKSLFLRKIVTFDRWSFNLNKYITKTTPCKPPKLKPKRASP